MGCQRYFLCMIALCAVINMHGMENGGLLGLNEAISNAFLVGQPSPRASLSARLSEARGDQQDAEPIADEEHDNKQGVDPAVDEEGDRKQELIICEDVVNYATGDLPLHAAIQSKNRDLALRLINAKAPLTISNYAPTKTPLVLAVEGDMQEVARAILDMNKGMLWQPTVTDALAQKKKEIMRWCKNSTIGFDKAIITAFKQSNFRMLHVLEQHQTHMPISAVLEITQTIPRTTPLIPTEHNKYCNPRHPVHYRIIKGEEEQYVMKHLDNRWTVDSRDDADNTPLCCAVLYDRFKIAEHILRRSSTKHSFGRLSGDFGGAFAQLAMNAICGLVGADPIGLNRAISSAVNHGKADMVTLMSKYVSDVPISVLKDVLSWREERERNDKKQQALTNVSAPSSSSSSTSSSSQSLFQQSE